MNCFYLITICVCILVHVSAQKDPCTSYKNLTDPNLRTDNTVLSSGRTPVQLLVGYYRYTGTTAGIIATSCPSGNQCGASRQVWITGTLPNYGTGSVNFDICIRQGTDCCGFKNLIQVNNCNGYFVYNLIPLPPDTHYCFNTSATPLTTVSTTTRISTAITTSTTTIPKSSTIVTTIGQTSPTLVTSPMSNQPFTSDTRTPPPTTTTTGLVPSPTTARISTTITTSTTTTPLVTTIGHTSPTSVSSPMSKQPSTPDRTTTTTSSPTKSPVMYTIRKTRPYLKTTLTTYTNTNARSTGKQMESNKDHSKTISISLVIGASLGAIGAILIIVCLSYLICSKLIRTAGSSRVTEKIQDEGNTVSNVKFNPQRLTHAYI